VSRLARLLFAVALVATLAGTGTATGARQRHPATNLVARRLDVPKYFSDAALTAASREHFVSSCIDLFIKGNLPGAPDGAAAGLFDGIDLDWEWPGSEGNAGNIIRAEDKQNFTKLAAEFRRQLDEYGATTGEDYLLTSFLPAAPGRTVSS
jgi:chitinase